LVKFANVIFEACAISDIIIIYRDNKAQILLSRSNEDESESWQSRNLGYLFLNAFPTYHVFYLG
jgi:hypothetical protein